MQVALRPSLLARRRRDDLFSHLRQLRREDLDGAFQLGVSERLFGVLPGLIVRRCAGLLCLAGGGLSRDSLFRPDEVKRQLAGILLRQLILHVRLHALSITWHTFDLDEIEKGTDEVLALLREKRGELRERKKNMTSNQAERR